MPKQSYTYTIDEIISLHKHLPIENNKIRKLYYQALFFACFNKYNSDRSTIILSLKNNLHIFSDLGINNAIREEISKFNDKQHFHFLLLLAACHVAPNDKFIHGEITKNIYAFNSYGKGFITEALLKEELLKNNNPKEEKDFLEAIIKLEEALEYDDYSEERDTLLLSLLISQQGSFQLPLPKLTELLTFLTEQLQRKVSFNLFHLLRLGSNYFNQIIVMQLDKENSSTPSKFNTTALQQRINKLNWTFWETNQLIMIFNELPDKDNRLLLLNLILKENITKNNAPSILKKLTY